MYKVGKVLRVILMLMNVIVKILVMVMVFVRTDSVGFLVSVIVVILAENVKRTLMSVHLILVITTAHVWMLLVVSTVYVPNSLTEIHAIKMSTNVSIISAVPMDHVIIHSVITRVRVNQAGRVDTVTITLVLALSIRVRTTLLVLMLRIHFFVHVTKVFMEDIVRSMWTNAKHNHYAKMAQLV